MERKNMKGVQTGKEEVILSLVAGDMIQQLKGLKDTTIRLLDAIKKLPN
jgi:hypothetical protein